MKINPRLENDYVKLCRNQSSDIEFDSILKYAQRISLFLEIKIEEEQKKTKSFDVPKQIIKTNINQALVHCDTSGITTSQQRIALEILNKYWVYGTYLKEIKVFV